MPARPAVEGWFTMDRASPRLIGQRCADCGTYYFPPGASACRNPDCGGGALEPTPLSATGRLWSYTSAGYRPPPPYVSPEPFAPFAIAAVELAAEGMIVLGQVVAGVPADALEVGMEMELALETLFTEGDDEVVVYKWRPAGGAL